MYANHIIKKSDIFFRKKIHEVSKNEIQNLENICTNYISESNAKLHKLITTFNDLGKEITISLSTDLPDNPDIILLSKGIKTMINMNYVEPISLFIKNVYIHDDYVRSIRKGKDDFFLNASPEDIIKNHDDSLGEDITRSNISDKIFQFKAYWKLLKHDTRDLIKAIMVTLIDITEKYIEIKDDTNEIAKILVKLNRI